jgi:5-methyltetrahydrofolate--homocysteine methyltransferase
MNTNSPFTYLDGAMGTMLQKAGMKTGYIPELLNLENPELIRSIHEAYLKAGSNIIYANTFGANPYKLEGTGHSVEEVVTAAISNAKEAAKKYNAKVALDVGPLGMLMEPLGTLTFEEAYEAYKPMVVAAQKAGADLIIFETMTDLYEVKAAVLAAKENTDLPIYVTMTFEENGRTFTGCTPESMARTLTALGVDALGLNCSLGPEQLAPIVKRLAQNTTLPVIAKPNAGLPDPVDSHYDMTPEEFGAAMQKCVESGATILGGCCGTNPDFISSLVAHTKEMQPHPQAYRNVSFVCTPMNPLYLDEVRVIGERINPTGKKRFQQALLEEDLDYIVSLALAQEEAGADILDINVGFPGVNEAKMMPKVIKKIQAVCSLPLQLDSSDPAALEAGLRVYNGKPSVNSVNAKPGVMKEILPMIKKYGASVVGLTIDEEGIPQTAKKRIELAKTILETAQSYGIKKEDVFIDALTLTVSAQQDQAVQTLQAVRSISEDLGMQTVLGVSNISFGLPNRPLITSAFLTQALANGLSLPIVNPNQSVIMDAIYAHKVLHMQDENSQNYISHYANMQENKPAAAKSSEMSLHEAILKGLKKDAAIQAQKELKQMDELELIEKHLIPSLDEVGDLYENGTLFLPQLLGAANAANAVFEVIKKSMAEKGTKAIAKDKIIMATVQGDIHDIGKNIVKTVLENYGYQVIDLGKDVAPEIIVEECIKQDCKLVGLSALMTTTLPSMEKTIQMLKQLENPPKTMVGGAVLTPEYAKLMGADYYSKDAKAGVEIAREVFGR